MKPDDIIIGSRMKNEDSIPWLEHYNKCHGFILIDDESDCKLSIPRHINMLFYGYKQNFSLTEMVDRELILCLASTFTDKWLLMLDQDEWIDDSFWDEIQGIPDDYDAVEFMYLVTYPDKDHFIVSGTYCAQYRPCMIKLSHTVSYLNEEIPPYLHGKRIPQFLRSGGKKQWNAFKSNSLLLHHSLLGDRRNRRISFYNQHDPHSKFQKMGYKHLQGTYKSVCLQDLHTVTDLISLYPELYLPKPSCN